MRVEQWSVHVRKEKGEDTRLSLLRRGILDRSLKIHTSGEDLVFPVTSPEKGIAKEFFETLEIPPVLPRHELIGGIALLQEKNEVEAERILHSRPSLHTVLFPMSAVEGGYRIRRFEVLAGIPTTRTEYTEYGHRYVIDLGVAYFSPRLSEERQRILHLMGRKEKVLDLFAGVGPFAITLSGQAFLIIACDINPDAVSLLLENSTLNRCNNILPILADASHLDGIIPWQFSRIIMNLPLSGQEYLEDAFSYCTSGGFIHFYILQSKKGEYLPLIEQFPLSSVEERVVRSYSPDKWHAVYDIQVA
ncbi:MAG: methyltransferase [Methanomicrobiales archaeon]|nr:methyltransferase [Methanomicrobiales archaeon]